MNAKEMAESMLEEGFKHLDAGNYSVAADKLEEAVKRGIEPNPLIDAAQAVCVAALQRQHKQAIDTCRWAIEQEPCESGLYLQLGRVYLLAGQRKEALEAFKEGMLYRRDQRIINELQRLGMRRRPFFDSLPRQHFLNRVAGRLWSKFRH